MAWYLPFLDLRLVAALRDRLGCALQDFVSALGHERVKLPGMAKRQTTADVRICPRLRVMCGNEIALGPGRVELLELIGETGSLRAAALRMGMSYMRAWNLVKYTNKCFTKPLVETSRGGVDGGGAALTKPGKEVIAQYRQMEIKSQKAMQQAWAGFKKFLKK